MEINRTCKLYLSNVYLYDIVSCHYTIIKRLGYNLDNINEEDKFERNKQIGIMMRDNPNLTTVLRTTTTSIVDDCLLRNNVTEDELILRQYDGFLTTRELRDTNIHFPLDLRKVFSQMLISSCRVMYIGRTFPDDKITIKGVSNRYSAMDEILKKTIRTCSKSKDRIFKTLSDIKDEILNSKDQNLYAIPSGDNTFSILLKKYGQYQVSKSFLKILDTDDIYKEWYYNRYIRPFAESIVIEFA